MQTRLRSRLGLTGEDPLPNSVVVTARRTKETHADGIQRAFSSSSIEAIAATNAAMSVPVGQQLNALPISPVEESLFQRVTRRQTSEGVLGPQPQSTSTISSNSATASATLQQSRRFLSLVPHHRRETVAFGHAHHRSDAHPASLVDSKTIVAKHEWKRIGHELMSAMLRHHHGERERERSNLHNQLSEDVNHVLNQMHHHERMQLIAADQESEFRSQLLLQAARERKRQRDDQAESQLEGMPPVVVDIDEGPEKRLLQIIDELDMHLALLAKRNEAILQKQQSSVDGTTHDEREGGGGKRLRRMTTARAKVALDDELNPRLVTAVQAQQAVMCTNSFPRLMPFQKEGVLWLMNSMVMQGVNCLLADEMGLGKTVSSIALMSAVAKVRQMTIPPELSRIEATDDAKILGAMKRHAIHPMLIVAPLSTLPNWEREIASFEPTVFETFVVNGDQDSRAQRLQNFFALINRYHGAMTVVSKRAAQGREKKFGRPKKNQEVTPACMRPVLWGECVEKKFRSCMSIDHDAPEAAARVPVVLIPHDYFARTLDAQGRALLYDISWELVVVDEAQRIKNNDCKLFDKLQALRAPHRLALTGTPLQNNILEVFALMEFILPDLFRSTNKHTARLMQMLHESLDGTNRKLGKSFEDEELQMLLCRRLHRFLSPFLLRREKAAVLDQLPIKDDVVVVCPMTSLQRVYLMALDERRHRKELSGHYTHGVRKILLHPYLMLNSFYIEERLAYAGGKFLVLDILLQFLQKFSHKVLVFCSWTKVLDIVESLCILRSMRCVRLEGKTKVEDRETNIRTFSEQQQGQGDSSHTSEGESSCNCFLISKIAGGVGLNLQAADTVILLDVDYNPQRDTQALARAYRVGQKKHVKVFRLVMDHPVEESMLKIAMEKHHLEEAVVRAGRYDLRSSAGDRDDHIRHLFHTMRRVDGTDGKDGKGCRLGMLAHHSVHSSSATQEIKKDGAADDDEAEVDDIDSSINSNVVTPSSASAPSMLITSYQTVVDELLLAAVPRSDEERVFLKTFLPSYWASQISAELGDCKIDHGEEERHWLRYVSS